MQKSNCDQSIDFFFLECDGSDENKYFKLQEMKCVWLLKKVSNTLKIWFLIFIIQKT